MSGMRGGRAGAIFGAYGSGKRGRFHRTVHSKLRLRHADASVGTAWRKPPSFLGAYEVYAGFGAGKRKGLCYAGGRQYYDTIRFKS